MTMLPLLRRRRRPAVIPGRLTTLLVAAVATAGAALAPEAGASAGRLDHRFGGGAGHVSTSFPNAVVRLGGLVPTSRGLVAVGSVGWPFVRAGVGFARYQADGAPDPSFGRGGSAVVNFPGLAEYAGVPTPEPLQSQVLRGAIDASGVGFAGRETTAGAITAGSLLLPEILVASEPAELVAARVRPDGAPDRSYGHNGVVVQPIAPFVLGGVYTANLGVHVNSDGSLLAGAWSYTLPPCGFGVPCLPPVSYLTFIRLTSTGALDRSFGTDGVRIEPTPEAWSYDAMVVTRDGHIVVGGGDAVQGLVRRFDADGLPDLAFGTGGVVVMDGTNQRLSFVNALAAVGNDVVAATGVQPVTDVSAAKTWIELRRLDPHGALVPSFGHQGVVVVPRSVPTMTLNATSSQLLSTGEEFAGGRSALIAAAFDARTGRIQWRSGPLSMANTWPAGAIAAGRRVFVGATPESPPSAFLLWALRD